MSRKLTQSSGITFFFSPFFRGYNYDDFVLVLIFGVSFTLSNWNLGWLLKSLFQDELFMSQSAKLSRPLQLSLFCC